MIDREEALGLLELAPDASAEAIRRAYLRGIKKHKPERDPERFRALRDAFELLSRSDSAGGAASPSPPARSTEPQSAEHPPIDVDGPTLRARLREAPDDDGARWLAYDLALSQGRKEEALALLRGGVRADAREFLIEIAQQFPAALTDAEFEAWRAGNQPQDALHEARVSAARGDHSAADRCLEVIEEARRGSSLGAFSPWLFADIILLLHEQQSPMAAERLDSAWRSFLQSEGAELDAQRALGVRYHLLRDFSRVSVELPVPLRPVVATFIRTRDIERFEADVRRLPSDVIAEAIGVVHDEELMLTRAMRTTLREVLDDTMPVRVLRRMGVRNVPLGLSTRQVLGGFVIFCVALFLLLARVRGGRSDPPRATTRRVVVASAPTAAEPRTLGDETLVIPDAPIAPTPAPPLDLLCGLGSGACAHAEAYREAVLVGRCDELQAPDAALDAIAAAQAEPSAAYGAIDALRIWSAHECRSE